MADTSGATIDLHGSASGYLRGCRCERCTAAHKQGSKPHPITQAERDTYLDAIAKGYTKKRAAEIAGRPRQRFHDLYKADEAFAALVDAAYREEGRDTLVEVARCRAVDGWDEPVYQKGMLVGHIRKYDHNLLALLIKQRDPSFRDRASVTLSGPNDGPLEVIHVDAIDAEIRKLLGELEARTEASSAQPAPDVELAGAGEDGERLSLRS